MQQFLKIFAVCALIGFGVFAFFVHRATVIENVESRIANERFRHVLSQFEDATPMLTMDRAGNVQHRTRDSKTLFNIIPSNLHVLAYRDGIGLVEVVVPLWFARVKGAALNYALRKTSFDTAKWQIDVDEIQAYGPGVIANYTSAAGERVLVWTTE